MRLSSKLGMQKSFHKLRFYADRRRVRKMRVCQNAVSKTSIKRSPFMSREEWKYLDSILTPFYCRKVEIQAERAEKLKSQLVSRSETQIIFQVWSEHADDDGDVEDDIDQCFHEEPCSDEEDLPSSGSESESDFFDPEKNDDGMMTTGATESELVRAGGGGVLRYRHCL